MGTQSNRENLNPSTVVMHRTEVYLKNEWHWYKFYGKVLLLQGTAREEIKTGCWILVES